MRSEVQELGAQGGTVTKRYPNMEVEAFRSLQHSLVVITDVTSYYEAKIVADLRFMYYV